MVDHRGLPVAITLSPGQRSDKAAVGAIAEERGTSRATVALAWHFTKGVTAPIIGATKPGHIGAALEAVTLGLTDEEVARLEAPYLPKAPVGVASTAPRDWSLTQVAG